MGPGEPVLSHPRGGGWPGPLTSHSSPFVRLTLKVLGLTFPPPQETTLLGSQVLYEEPVQGKG